MGLRDVTGVFSRYFIVGFFIPAFTSLAFLKLILSDRWIPDTVEPNVGQSFLVLGGLALVMGLVLLGLREPILDMVSGYFLIRTRASWLGRLVSRPGERLRGRQVADFRELSRQAAPFVSLRDQSEEDRARARANPELVRESARAVWRLDRCFPQIEAKVLPTRLGNRLRATEDYIRTRWSLEPVTIGARVESLLSEQEVKLHADADTDLAFFLNHSLLAPLAGLVAVIDLVVNHPHPPVWVWTYALPFLASVAFYRAAVSASERRGALARASYDLHRSELFQKFGLRRPSSREEELREGRAVTQFLMYGWDFPADLREPVVAAGKARDPAADLRPSAPLSRLRHFVSSWLRSP